MFPHLARVSSYLPGALAFEATRLSALRVARGVGGGSPLRLIGRWALAPRPPWGIEGLILFVFMHPGFGSSYPKYPKT